MKGCQLMHIDENVMSYIMSPFFLKTDLLALMKTSRIYNALWTPYFISQAVCPLSIINQWEPKKRTYVTMIYTDGGDQHLVAGMLPSGLELLMIMQNINHPVISGVLPANLIYLLFKSPYNHPLVPGVLPNSLKALELGDAFNQSLVSDVLPTGLKTLKFGAVFNQPLVLGVLPTGLEHLTLEVIDRHCPWSAGLAALPASLSQLVINGLIINRW